MILSLTFSVEPSQISLMVQMLDRMSTTVGLPQDVQAVVTFWVREVFDFLAHTSDPRGQCSNPKISVMVRKNKSHHLCLEIWNSDEAVPSEELVQRWITHRTSLLTSDTVDLVHISFGPWRKHHRFFIETTMGCQNSEMNRNESVN